MGKYLRNWECDVGEDWVIFLRVRWRRGQWSEEAMIIFLFRQFHEFWKTLTVESMSETYGEVWAREYANSNPPRTHTVLHSHICILNAV